MSEGTSYEAYLKERGSLTYSNVGVSMLPLLRQGRDLFTVERKDTRRCKRGDVVLYRRGQDQYVLHRIVEVRTDDYVTLGDNCVAKEYGIVDADVIGVMTGYVRDGRAHSVTEPGYRLYTFLWLHTAPLRVWLLRLRQRMKGPKP